MRPDLALTTEESCVGTLRRIGIIAIPATFLLAGIGMLWLLAVENASGSFYEQIQSNGRDWVGAHLVLLASVFFMLPAALTMRSAIDHRLAAMMGTAMVLVIAPTTILLAGQYAIDFLVPIIVQIGGEALDVHRQLFQTPLVNTLFYGLPNLVFVALMVLSVSVVWGGILPRLAGGMLLVNWLVVLLGNLVHPALQRSAILLLAISFLPLTRALWSGRNTDADAGR